MKCPCGKERPFLINGKCEECNAQNKPKRYIVEICKGWYYDGSKCKTRIPAKKTRKYAYEFTFRKAAINRALEFGGKVEEV